MTQEQIEELRALNAKRTQGEWRDVYDEPIAGLSGIPILSVTTGEDAVFEAEDAAFIVAAANHMDALLSLAAQAERMREALEKLLSYNEDIIARRINYRPEDHAAVARAALEPKP